MTLLSLNALQISGSFLHEIVFNKLQWFAAQAASFYDEGIQNLVPTMTSVSTMVGIMSESMYRMYLKLQNILNDQWELACLIFSIIYGFSVCWRKESKRCVLSKPRRILIDTVGEGRKVRCRRREVGRNARVGYIKCELMKSITTKLQLNYLKLSPFKQVSSKVRVVFLQDKAPAHKGNVALDAHFGLPTLCGLTYLKGNNR